jgi:hypothetical protein
VAKFEVQSWYLLSGTKESRENFSKDRQSQEPRFKIGNSECEARELTAKLGGFLESTPSSVERVLFLVTSMFRTVCIDRGLMLQPYHRTM